MKILIRCALLFYFKRIRIIGLENVPKNKPILFLSNHQNALLDVLLIVTHVSVKPWFLTRADVFNQKRLIGFFNFLQMLPIYRIRDGKNKLQKNQQVFERCAQLLDKNEAIALFPEANHSLKRRVRPLSKGFTRIINSALERNPKMDLHLIPIGQNYQRATAFPDSCSLYFGEPIIVKNKHSNLGKATIEDTKQKVTSALQKLTVHIDEDVYDGILNEIHNVDFTKPELVNAAFDSNTYSQLPKSNTPNLFSYLKGLVFEVINFPVIQIWRFWLKPKVPEDEFKDTFRFGYGLLAMPLFYLLLLGLLLFFFKVKTACLLVVIHAALNIILIKMDFTSFAQRK
ncbi:hypothetical protein GCM10011414_19660 [Croceivirga lutea]|uniref:1-acyl-sn-glycerol-3-phosphate acyltransferase n=1 Tax=Croceivirga lutea TaxID=1775167 RepID=UPI001639C83E|nr:1-acyl-sn-glycerol-3-phosphate acyltransferase [Croceivirga lutea]GGG49910.1 hypothetical protein GCM10011414_19660 [Croceivirga lutea]